MKKSLLIISTILLAGFVGCSTPSSSSEPSSSESTVVDTRTPKEKVLDLCEEIIDKNKDKKLFATTQTMSGKVNISSLDSTTYIYSEDQITLENVVMYASTEQGETNKSLMTLNGDYKYKHLEEYTGTEDASQIELTNINEEGTVDEKIMTLGDDFYCDLSSFFNDFFSDEEITKSPNLMFKQDKLGTIISDAVKESYPDMDTSVEIPEINPHELLEEFVSEESLFNEYLKYAEESNGLKLKLSLKPQDFNQLLTDIMLEADPESNIPVSTIFSMENGSMNIVFNFSEDDISSMDISIDGRFSILADQYSLNVKVNGNAVNTEISEFTPFANYADCVSLETLGWDVGAELKDILSNLDFETDEESGTVIPGM